LGDLLGGIRKALVGKRHQVLIDPEGVVVELL
jgi:hypothetical protein